MKIFEYMAPPLSLMPEEIVEQYNLNDLAHNGMVYIEIQKAIPGLKQAGKIAHDRLREHLKNTVTPQLSVHLPYGDIIPEKIFFHW